MTVNIEMFLAICVVALSFIGGSFVWIIFKSVPATITTIFGCVLFSIIVIGIIIDLEED